MFAVVLHLDVQRSFTSCLAIQFWPSATEAALCLQAPTIAENTPMKVSGGLDQVLSSQQYEEADHTPAEGLPTSSPDKAVPVSSEQSSDAAASKAPGAFPQKAFGSPSVFCSCSSGLSSCLLAFQIMLSFITLVLCPEIK